MLSFMMKQCSITLVILKYFNVQFKRAQLLSSDNRIEEALYALAKLIKIDPLNEAVYLCMMQYQYSSGNKVASICKQTR